MERIIQLPARTIDTTIIHLPLPAPREHTSPQGGEILPLETPSPFIEANTQNVGLDHLRRECIVPVFAKDNETTISHTDFIEVVSQAVKETYRGEHYSLAVRVSHEVKGRIPEAVGKPVRELLPHEKTIYYERMAFVLSLESQSAEVNGNLLHLTVGGVRAYNLENLYNRKGLEKFKVFVGFKNTVCTNLCVATDGYKQELRASAPEQLFEAVMELLRGYNRDNHIRSMRQLQETRITQAQFAQMLGRARMYQFLPPEQKRDLPLLSFTDGQVHAVAKEYFGSEHFGTKEDDGSIDLWKVYNLFTGANKSSYIDTFLDRSVNAFDFTRGIADAVKGEGEYRWFLE